MSPRGCDRLLNITVLCSIEHFCDTQEHSLRCGSWVSRGMGRFCEECRMSRTFCAGKVATRGFYAGKVSATWSGVFLWGMAIKAPHQRVCRMCGGGGYGGGGGNTT